MGFKHNGHNTRIICNIVSCISKPIDKDYQIQDMVLNVLTKLNILDISFYIDLFLS